MRRPVIASVCLLAIALLLGEAVAHDHASASSEERSQRHGCVVCTGAIDQTPAMPAAEPTTFVVAKAKEPQPAPALPAQLDPFHSGNAPPASRPLA